MSLSMMAMQAIDTLPHHLAMGSLHADTLNHVAAMAGPHAGAEHTSNLVHLAQAGGDAANSAGGAAGGMAADPSSYADRVDNLSQEEQVGWLSTIGRHFIGVFQKGGETFAGFVTGIIPTLIVLMTAFYAVTEIIGEKRVHGAARMAGSIALTRYTVLPVMAMFFLTNPMAYTFGTFLEEKHKPAFYDSAVSFCHPITGLFPHANPGEYFVWGGVLVALQQLESQGVVPENYHIRVAIFYFLVGIVVILLRGILTERMTAFMAKRQKVEL